MFQNPKIAFLGAGNMAEALVAGIGKAKLSAPEFLLATDISPSRLELLKDRYHIQVGAQNLDAVLWADVIILCVKPQVVHKVLTEIQTSLSEKQLVISLAAGVPIKGIQEKIGQTIPLVRAMPNTPAVIQEGVTALAGCKGLSLEQLKVAQGLFESVGKVVVVDESLMDAVTGLSGSGPAYVYLAIEALIDGGVRVGLPRNIAHILAVQTVLGAAKMVRETGEHPALLKDRVTSPGGTTIAGLQRLEEGGLRATLIEAVEAATHRSSELGKSQY
ncbi:MAG: pyrroline-5-carboxylate reductase [Nitrospirales bacterium]